MANSMVAISRRLYRSLLSSTRISQTSMPFCTNSLSSGNESEPDESAINSDSEPVAAPASSGPPSQGSGERKMIYDRPLENGLDVGVYKAILVGKVGQNPVQKKLKSGRTVTLFSVGTGGIRNNRRPLENEDPREYANRSAVQWHRVSIYPERLGDVVMKQFIPGSTVYLEGNLETKVFTDPITGMVRRIREVAIRRNGRVVFVGKGDDETQQSTLGQQKGVGYY